MWDLSSPTRDQTCTPCIGDVKSQPLDQQGSSLNYFFTCLHSLPDWKPQEGKADQLI